MRGISGGERKRVSIAHEMLMNPSLLILDEPTSGLDATAAFRLVATLGRMAEEGRRTVVMSVHQPSSRVYQVFDSALVLSEGRCIYFGKGSEAMGYFEAVGFSPSFPMNPADFLLDLANGTSSLSLPYGIYIHISYTPNTCTVETGIYIYVSTIISFSLMIVLRETYSRFRAISDVQFQMFVFRFKFLKQFLQ